MDFPASLDRGPKRLRGATSENDELAQTLLDYYPIENDDFWNTAELFQIVDNDNQDPTGINDAGPSRKRKERPYEVNENGQATGTVVEQLIPGAAPSVPSLPERVVNLSLENPYAPNYEISEHPRLTSVADPVIIPTKRVNHAEGLLKFHLRFNDPQMPQKSREAFTKHHQRFTDQMATKPGEVSYLPRDFGRGLNLNEMDTRLFKFYLVAYCAGRTLLENSNIWLKGVPSIAEKHPCVKHAMLSLAAGYVLDYAPSPKLKKAASDHHRRAVMLLGLELNKPENYEPGKEEPLLMALSLLNSEDIVNWEPREATKHAPKWYGGQKAIKYLLDKSDPGYRYQKSWNVQSTTNRYSMSHYQIKSLILSDTCAPLQNDMDDYPFRWLLEGSDREVRRITGLAGCCPKILHTFAQITNLAAQLKANPTSKAIPAAGKVILERLTNFKQWSDFMKEPFDTPEELFAACEANFDENGKVQTAALSVALNGECYVQSCQLYLLCRLFRLPRRHPEVQSRLRKLLWCTDWLPLDGPLYTAQDSLYGLALLGLLAVEEEHREIVERQFAPLEMGPRGNTPPIWKCLTKLWRWMDEDLQEDDVHSNLPIHERIPWWELMVEHIWETEGRLNLS